MTYATRTVALLDSIKIVSQAQANITAGRTAVAHKCPDCLPTSFVLIAWYVQLMADSVSVAHYASGCQLFRYPKLPDRPLAHHSRPSGGVGILIVTRVGIVFHPCPTANGTVTQAVLASAVNINSRPVQHIKSSFKQRGRSKSRFPVGFHTSGADSHP
jgi:hypothetical protein